MTNGIQNRPRQDITYSSSGVPAYDQQGVPQQGAPQQGVPPGSQNIQINIHPGAQQGPNVPPYVPYRSEVIVRQRRSPGIVWTLFEVAAGLVLFAVIIIVLLTGLGAMMVNLGTDGGLPLTIVEYSLGYYHYFFG